MFVLSSSKSYFVVWYYTLWPNTICAQSHTLNHLTNPPPLKKARKTYAPHNAHHFPTAHTPVHRQKGEKKETTHTYTPSSSLLLGAALTAATLLLLGLVAQWELLPCLNQHAHFCAVWLGAV